MKYFIGLLLFALCLSFSAGYSSPDIGECAGDTYMTLIPFNPPSPGFIMGIGGFVVLTDTCVTEPFMPLIFSKITVEYDGVKQEGSGEWRQGQIASFADSCPARGTVIKATYEWGCATCGAKGSCSFTVTVPTE